MEIERLNDIQVELLAKACGVKPEELRIDLLEECAHTSGVSVMDFVNHILNQ